MWKGIKQTQEYLVMYLYTSITEIDKLKRFNSCLEKYKKDDSNLAIRTTVGYEVTYQYIFTDILNILIKLNETVPQISRDKIMALLN